MYLAVGHRLKFEFESLNFTFEDFYIFGVSELILLGKLDYVFVCFCSVQS